MKLMNEMSAKKISQTFDFNLKFQLTYMLYI